MDAADRRPSRFWHATFSGAYWLLAHGDPLIRPFWRLGWLGITARLHVAGRISGRPRPVLLLEPAPEKAA